MKRKVVRFCYDSFLYVVQSQSVWLLSLKSFFRLEIHLVSSQEPLRSLKDFVQTSTFLYLNFYK